MALERFYEAEYPPLDAVVMAKFVSMGDALIQANLMEYGKTAFMVRPSFLRGQRAYPRLGRPYLGQEAPLRVLRVIPDRDFIDLSPDQLSDDVINTHKDIYHKSKMVVAILRHTCIQMSLDEESCEDLVRKTSWYLDRKSNRIGQAYETFQLAVSNPGVLDVLDINGETKDVLLRVIRLKLSPQVFSLRSVVEVTCYAEEGIDAVKTALRAGLSVSSPTCPIQIRVCACPEYEITSRTSDQQAGIRSLQAAQHLIEDTIALSGGKFRIVKEPSVRDHSQH